MKLLNFFVIFQIYLSTFIGFNFTILNFAQASEVAESYEVRYQRWQDERNKSRLTLQERLRNLKSKSTEEPKAQISDQKNTSKAIAEKRAPQSIEATAPTPTLSKILPNKIEVENEDSLAAVKKDQSAAENRTRKNIDAQEDFLSQIPKSNKQVQALLTMIDHAKVYYSINTDGRLKDLFKDDRFREIYTQEMEPATRKSTYLFFKGYQDHNRNPNEPIKPKLNRDTTITREKLEGYLETSGIKSKLTRSLQGSYPKLPKAPAENQEAQNESAEATSAPVGDGAL